MYLLYCTSSLFRTSHTTTQIVHVWWFSIALFWHQVPFSFLFCSKQAGAPLRGSHCQNVFLLFTLLKANKKDLPNEQLALTVRPTAREIFFPEFRFNHKKLFLETKCLQQYRKDRLPCRQNSFCLHMSISLLFYSPGQQGQMFTTCSVLIRLHCCLH